MDLQFDEATHKYTLNGRPVPSVTQVLNVLFPPWPCEAWYLERGRAVHECYKLLSKGVKFTPDPVCLPYIDGWYEFMAGSGIDISEAEIRVGSEKYQFAGTLDIVYMPKGTLTHALGDYKASECATAGLQLAAYSQALIDMGNKPINEGMQIIIGDDGRWSVKTYDLKRLRNDWLACLSVYGMQQKINRRT